MTLSTKNCHTGISSFLAEYRLICDGVLQEEAENIILASVFVPHRELDVVSRMNEVVGI